MPAELSSIYRN